MDVLGLPCTREHLATSRVREAFIEVHHDDTIRSVRRGRRFIRASIGQ